MTYSGNRRLGDLFSSRREKGRPGLPTLSVTLNDGLVNREDLDRKQETNLAPEEHLLVKPGDIAYNMMRMWQGAFGLANGQGLVSPAYVILRPKAVDPRYASYWFKTKRMLYLFWAYSYGLTDDRLRLYFPDFARIPCQVPQIEVQQQVANCLEVWERSIETVEHLIRGARRQKRALVQRLLPRPHTPKTAHAGWNLVRLEDVVAFNPRKSKRPEDGRVSFLAMESVSEDGHVIRPTERQYDDVCTGYSAFQDADILVAKITPCFENGKGALVMGLTNGIGFGSTEFHVLRPRGDVYAGLIKHIVGSREFRLRGKSEMEGSAGQKRISSSFIRSFRFMCPQTQAQQKEVADLLDLADLEIHVFEDCRASLVKEFGALRERLCYDARYNSHLVHEAFV
jgi:type I restriction enzyme S subunit